MPSDSRFLFCPSCEPSSFRLLKSGWESGARAEFSKRDPPPPEWDGPEGGLTGAAAADDDSAVEEMSRAFVNSQSRKRGSGEAQSW